MLDYIIALCTTSGGQATLIMAGDLLIAAAYFSIPFSMLWVFRHRRVDLPYPWLWIAFVAFIFACGLTHAAHVVAAAIGAPLLEWRAAIQVATAVVSIGTAVALNLVLPQINLLPSPQQQRYQLEQAVARATREKDALLLELNHRVGNQLAKLAAAVRMELREGEGGGDREALLRIQTLLNDLGAEHHRLSRVDYSLTHPARNFMRADSGTTEAAALESAEGGPEEGEERAGFAGDLSRRSQPRIV